MFPKKIDDKYTLDFIKETDAANLFSLVDSNRAYLRTWLPWLDVTKSVSDSEGFVKSAVEDNSSKKSLTLTVKNTENEEKASIVGMVSFHEIDWAKKQAGVGYWLAQDFQGQGIMTKAVKSIIDFGFFAYGLELITISIAEKNEKSLALPKKLGFSETEKIKDKEWLYDHYVSHIIYKMLAAKWRQLQRKQELSHDALSKLSRSLQ